MQQGQLALPEENQLKPFQWRFVFTAGMGFFTDAYDLFIIGVVTLLLTPLWGLTTGQLALLNAASLASAAFGAIFFGFLADKFGRKKMYGWEVAILFWSAILSAFAPNFTCLLIARVLVGLGIGGDYPSSAIIASEHASSSGRGFLVLMVFAMQAIGLIVGPLLASALLLTHLPLSLIWRLLLGFGAIPAIAVFYLRRNIKETPHYLRSQSTVCVASRLVTDLVKPGNNGHLPAFQAQKLFSKKWLMCLLGTAGSWFLFDIAFYGNSVSATLLLKTLNPHGDLVSHTLISALIFFLFAMPGYFLAAHWVDQIGRKVLQWLGFTMMALMYLLIALVPGVMQDVIPFVLIFGMSFFFVNFGPNTTTFLIPSEIYPTNIRARAHGISAALGKLGAFVGVFALPFILKFYGIAKVFELLAIVCLLGWITTSFLPEMATKSLEETEIKQASEVS